MYVPAPSERHPLAVGGMGLCVQVGCISVGPCLSPFLYAVLCGYWQDEDGVFDISNKERLGMWRGGSACVYIVRPNPLRIRICVCPRPPFLSFGFPGKTEVQLVQTMIDGVRTLIDRERELEEDRVGHPGSP
jgi:hypothetical protein